MNNENKRNLEALMVEGSNEDGTITFIASTSGIKRDGLDLDQSKWNLINYERNGVFLWSHDELGVPSIGSARAYLEADALKIDVTFDDEDDFASGIKRKYERGFLNAVSASWLVNADSTFDLLEVSAVNVPADPDALIQRKRSLETELGDIQEVLGERQVEAVEEVEAITEDLEVVEIVLTDETVKEREILTVGDFLEADDATVEAPEVIEDSFTMSRSQLSDFATEIVEKMNARNLGPYSTHELHTALQASVQDLVGEQDVYFYIIAIYDEYFVLENYDYNSGEAFFYQHTYSVSESGDVTVDPNGTEVVSQWMPISVLEQRFLDKLNKPIVEMSRTEDKTEEDFIGKLNLNILPIAEKEEVDWANVSFDLKGIQDAN